MLTPEEYTAAWAIYVAASMLVIVTVWGWTSWISLRPFRNLIRGLIAVALLTPVDVPPSDNEWAPAIAAMFFDVITKENSLPFVGPAYFFACVGLLFIILIDLVFSGFRDKKAK